MLAEAEFSFALSCPYGEQEGERTGRKDVFTQEKPSASGFYLGPTMASVACSEGLTKHLLGRTKNRQRIGFAKQNEQQQFRVAL